MVNIDKVYQKVLAIANKEQRGYVTPQEFNLFADQSQMEIFEQYFYDLDQFERRIDSDIIELLDEKMQIFKQASTPVNHEESIPSGTYKIDDVWIKYPGEKRSIVQRISRNEVQSIKSSPLLRTHLAPTYYLIGNTIRFVDPLSANGEWRWNLIRKPVSPKWTYMIDPISKSALYNSTAGDHKHFELHSSEESELVYRILTLAGIAIQKPELSQMAVGLQTQKEQIEKQ